MYQDYIPATVLAVAQALAKLWIHLGVPPAGFTQQTYGNLFSFQLQRQRQP
jgi:hypothetical protein